MIKWILNNVPRPLLIKASYVARPFLSILLRGSTFTDPIDGKSFKRFLPYGYGKTRANVLSPSTLSLERHRLLWLYLKRETDFFSMPRKMLHVAPEQAFYHRFKNLPHLNYTTTDLESPLADVKADICNLPFADNHFEVIFCNHVLEHIPDDTKAMQELYRVLKPGGFAILQVPQDIYSEKTFEDDTITDPKKRAEIFGQYDHVRVYGKDYFDRLSKIGFKVQPIHYAQQLSIGEVQKFCLDPKEILPLVYK
ncbi:class I SAM-dependent methyltransferase [Mesonia sediminis]|uniref:Class I SAM-dependent methyltransferase n=1 Tax=Mesonia sediminis TaxID=1703946 RepID=A0ABW5SG31_9FLAO